MTREKQKKLQAFYTPDVLADKMGQKERTDCEEVIF